MMHILARIDVGKHSATLTVTAALGIVIAIFGAIAGISSFHPFNNLASLLALSVVVLVRAVAAKLRV